MLCLTFLISFTYSGKIHSYHMPIKHEFVDLNKLFPLLYIFLWLFQMVYK